MDDVVALRNSFVDGGLVAQRLVPVTNTVQMGWPGFKSRLGYTILSLYMAPVYTHKFLRIHSLS